MTDVIADLPVDDRPRERLLMHGAETLSDAELLAILLGSGVRGKNAIQLGRELLGEGMSGLRRREPARLDQHLPHHRGPAAAQVEVGWSRPATVRVSHDEDPDPGELDQHVTNFHRHPPRRGQ